MNTETITTIITAVITSGLISTVIAPYINWQMHVRKDRREKQKTLIKETRNYFAGNNFGEWMETPFFYQLTPHLNKEEMESIVEYSQEIIEIGEENEQEQEKLTDSCKHTVQKAINRLEKKWKLI